MMDYIQELLLRQAALWMMRSVPDFSAIPEQKRRQTNAVNTAAASPTTMDVDTLSVSPTAAAVDTLSVSPTTAIVDTLPASLTAAMLPTAAVVGIPGNTPDIPDITRLFDRHSGWQAIAQALAQRKSAVQQQAAQHRTTTALSASATVEDIEVPISRQAAVDRERTRLSPTDRLYLQTESGSNPVDSVGMRRYRHTESTLAADDPAFVGGSASDVGRQMNDNQSSAPGSRSDTSVSARMTTVQRSQMSPTLAQSAAGRRSRSSDVVETEVTVQTAGQGWDPVESSEAADALSHAIERDARRYDGGYRLY